jgi:gliotoxin/aspirochlorine biosynthesis gamma-glutamylcyclotransferase
MKTVADSADVLVWYLAYGSNMSSAKFTGSRGIVPLASARVRVPGWILAFNIPGLPYSEPSFTSIVPRTPASGLRTDRNGLSGIELRNQTPCVLGVAYLLSKEQYVKVIGSEGGGIAYDDIGVEAEPVGEDDRSQTGGKIMARTLGPTMLQRTPWPRPSKRYLVSLVRPPCFGQHRISWSINISVACNKSAELPL